MSNRQVSLFTAAAIALTTFASAAVAAEPTVGEKTTGAKTTGAMTLATLGRATNGTQVARQGGFASAGAVQWIQAPIAESAIVKTPIAKVSAAAQAF
ncbi:hypothetical protein ASG40_02845 [Methylobacterium sp. Leaf399]|uniref:hypothetical protein n=1 Tax=unclassified Methylobacterium TaxID=2615210 RepID=UPI000701B237|nr:MULTISPECIES: hypothetical protein [unclassified Methylobacterium]KQP61623.1 hypothetical protein ASF39_02835 [Methylobacterium sp. Leaf108]KQT19773.1 hypothetical protein ASG40_02845 [Methylobacterium sp. Leaf399]KQT80823.1 hypothetical protein ASG59_05270 [Methylobacterium sp. Leaf466]